MDLTQALAEIERLKANAERGKRKHQKQLQRTQIAVAHRNNFKRQLCVVQQNAERYEKLRRWMSSNVVEGWGEVQKLAAIACYVDWNAFDKALDALPVCNVGLCEVRVKMCDCNQGRLSCTCRVIT